MLDECGSRSIALCFCLVWLMYFASKLAPLFFFCYNPQTEELTQLLSDSWSRWRCLLFWKPASSENICFSHTLLWCSVHTCSSHWHWICPRCVAIWTNIHFYCFCCSLGYIFFISSTNGPDFWVAFVSFLLSLFLYRCVLAWSSEAQQMISFPHQTVSVSVAERHFEKLFFFTCV